MEKSSSKFGLRIMFEVLAGVQVYTTVERKKLHPAFTRVLRNAYQCVYMRACHETQIHIYLNLM